MLSAEIAVESCELDQKDVTDMDVFDLTAERERLGLAPDGLVRAGCACYTTAEEIDRLLGAVGEL